MALWQRFRMIFSAKASKALDRAEDPNDTLDYSYQKMLEMQQKVRRGVADVATSRKRLEIQMTQLQQASDKLTTQAQTALGQGREDLAREALTRKSGLTGQLVRPPAAARAAAGGGGEAHPGLPAAADQDRGLPHPQGDAEGDLQRRQGADLGQRGLLGHLQRDGRRRPGHRARRGQDRADAGPLGRHRRAHRLRRAGGPGRRRRRRHRPRAGRAVLHLAGRGRAGPAQGRRPAAAGHRQHPGPAGHRRRGPRRRTRSAAQPAAQPVTEPVEEQDKQ